MKSHTNFRCVTETHFFDLSVPERELYDPGRTFMATSIAR